MRFFALLFSVVIFSVCGGNFSPNGLFQPQTAAAESVLAQSRPPAHTLPLFPNPMKKTELMERQRVPNYVTVLLLNADYAQLEELAEHYRKTKDRTPSGLWYLSLFHSGVSQFMWTVPKNRKTLPSGKPWSGTEDDFRAAVLDEWQAAFPNSPNPYLARAAVLKAQAWEIRGPSFANEVPREAWRPFLEKLTEARDYLVKHRAIAAHDPEWYVLRINMATELSEPTETIVELLSQAMEAEPHYYKTYFAAARHFLPKWGGNLRYMPALANMAVERTKEEDGKSAYARIYWYVWGNNDGGPHVFFDPHFSPAKMAEGMNDILRSYPDQWNINNFLHFSCMIGDRKQAKKMLAQMLGEPIMAVWKEAAVLNECKDFARGLDRNDKFGSLN